jgi:hypothetical protein
VADGEAAGMKEKFLHHEFDLGSQDVVKVTLDRQANVKLLDLPNYLNYLKKREYNYYGGLAKSSPIRISAPRAGHWHLVIDRGGHSGTVKASARVITRKKDKSK